MLKQNNIKLDDETKLLDLIKTQYIKEQTFTRNLIPSEKIKILGKKLFDELILLIEEVYAYNNKYIDQKYLEITILLNTDKQALYIKKELMKVMEEYCNLRISKHNSKDKNEFEKYLRISGELLPIIGNLVYHENSLNSFFLLDVFKFSINYLSENILGLKENFTKSKKVIEQKKLKETDSIEIKRNKSISKLINNDSAVEQILYLDGYDTNNYPSNIIKLKESLQILVDDIIEMKPFIFKDTTKETYSSIKINKNLSVKWFWKFQDNNIGSISGVINHTYMLTSINVNINDIGLLTEPNDKFLTTEKIFNQLENIKLFQINLLILEYIHDYLFSLYEQIDTNNFLEEYYNNEIEETEDNDLKALSLISTSLSDERKLKNKGHNYRIRKNTTWQKFLKILEEDFNCRVDYQGKGDDIKIYKKNMQDTKIYRTSAPKTKKREILVQTQIKILKKIGISVKEWVSERYNKTS